MALFDLPGDWVVEWSGGGLTRKRVVLVNQETGERFVGADWQDWDAALRRALSHVEETTGLVAEVEAFLRDR